MLSLQKNLSHIDWKHLSHAYGSATDTPIHLLTLLSDDAEEQERALDQLWASICHQGSVYSASEAAIPFLIQILQEVPDEQKPSILDLLDGLAIRSWYARRDQVTLEIDRSNGESRHHWKSMAQFLQEGNEYHRSQWMHQCHLRVGEGLPTYLALLQSAHRETVEKVLALLTGFQELSQDITPAVTKLFSETNDPALKAKALSCLGYLLDTQAAQWEVFHQFVTSDLGQIDPQLRSTAAYQLAKHHPKALSSGTVEILVTDMLHPYTFETSEKRYTTYSIDCQILSQLGIPLGLEALISALEQGASHWSLLDTMRVAEAMLDVTFFGAWVENRYWHYRTGDNPFAYSESAFMRETMGSTIRSDPYYDQEIPDLEGDIYPHFKLNYSRVYSSSSEFLIEVFGYDKHEASTLKSLHDQQGQQALSESQRRAVQVILRCKPLWQFKHNLMEIYGLPIALNDLVHFLALPEAD